MAIYHLSGTVISRSQGRSAVACAAYRSGERLQDERYDKTHDYTRKQDVLHREILTPLNAPEWMSNREQLWNGVEAHEKRKDAQLAREFNFALPKELTLNQNKELARTFVQNEFVSKGMVADLCLHLDKNKEGELLPHAHVMLTMREITSEGFGEKVRAWNDKALLVVWREAWAETANRFLALNGHDQQIDHRTLEAQSIALEPQYKIGASLARDKMARLEDHQRIARQNGERLLANPEIALKAITAQQSTFTHQDLARFVNRHTIDAEQFGQVYEGIKQHSGIVHLGVDEQRRERFTSHEMLHLERTMLSDARTLFERHKHVISNIDSPSNLSTEQQEAFQSLVGGADIQCIVGYAGTGKSYLFGEVREAWEKAGYRVHGVALAGIAAEGLQLGSGIESRTLASRFYYWDKGEQKLGSRDILVVDEAGMLGSRQIARLVHEAKSGGAKLVLVGDHQQLQAIEAGAAFRAMTEQVGFQELVDVRRQKIPWQIEATKAFARGEVASALQAYGKTGHIHEFQTQALARAGMIGVWNDARLQNPHQTQMMMAYTRVDVAELNQLARELRHTQGELGSDILLATERGQKPFASEDRIHFLKNDRSMGVMNGSLGTLERIKGDSLIVLLDGKDRAISFSIHQYPYLDHGYAATIHKAQGVTVDREYLLASRYCDAHSTYVGMTRHRESADLFWSTEEFANQRALVNTLNRDRAKDVSLDYRTTEEAYGRVRGIEPDTLNQNETRSKAIEIDLVEPFATPRESLEAFKNRFEAENPERAKRLRYEVLPTAEREAIDRENDRQQQAAALAIEKATMQEKTRQLEAEKTLERSVQKSRDFGLEL